MEIACEGVEIEREAMEIGSFAMERGCEGVL